MKLSTVIQKKGKRILAVALAVVMVNSVMDYSGIMTANAATDNGQTEGGASGSIKTITAFAALEENIAYQNLPLGAEETDIKFPENLTVTVSSKTEETIEEATTEEATTEEATMEEITTTEESNTEKNTEEATSEVESEGQTGEADSSESSGEDVQQDEEPSSKDPDTQESEAEATPDESAAAKTDTLVSKIISAFAPMTVYAAETESEDDTESKGDTEEMTEEITLTGITWKIDADNSTKIPLMPALPRRNTLVWMQRAM